MSALSFRCLKEQTDDRKIRGYTAGRWSLNRPVYSKNARRGLCKNSIAASSFCCPSD